MIERKMNKNIQERPKSLIIAFAGGQTNKNILPKTERSYEQDLYWNTVLKSQQ